MTEGGRPLDKDRRLGERRRSMLRHARLREEAAEESWFGVAGVSAEAEDLDVDRPRERESRRKRPDPGVGPLSLDPASSEAASAIGSPPGTSPDARFFSRQARRIVSAGQTTFERIYAAFISARVVLGAALLLTQLATDTFGAHAPSFVSAVCTLYAGLAIGTWLLPRLRKVDPQAKVPYLTRRQWLATIGVDIVSFSTLHIVATQSNLSYTALLVLPVLMGGVLTSRLTALATTAAVTLVLLANAGAEVASGAEATQTLTQIGLTGAGFFVVTLLAGELAGRLAREELTSRGSLEIARQQAQLNRLVIEEMQDGVLVVDRRGRVRAANPAARLLLAPVGMSRAAPFSLHGVEAWKALVDGVERAFVEGSWPEGGRDLPLDFEDGLKRTLRARVRFTKRRDSNENEDFCVLFLEDMRNVQARTRQEKLAAMGRVSAGIAHEIRNPLAAISQANALLAEDATDASQRRLTQMVSDNVERLKRIVNDVLEVGSGVELGTGAIDAVAHVAAVCSEWSGAEQLRLGDQSPLWVDLPEEPLGVIFDQEHLRRVMVNLLDNAKRHASSQPGAIRVRLSPRDEFEATLSITSDGAPIPPEVERYLFEPFFSTRSRGTGLGLYICRELCERYGASIDYRLRPPGDANRNEFFVAMRRAPLVAATEARLHLTP